MYGYSLNHVVCVCVCCMCICVCVCVVCVCACVHVFYILKTAANRLLHHYDKRGFVFSKQVGGIWGNRTLLTDGQQREIDLMFTQLRYQYGDLMYDV